MLKKIMKSELRLGMYILDLECNWLNHPFFRGSFMLRKQVDLNRILASNVTAVCIDTLKGLDVAGAGVEAPPAALEPPAAPDQPRTGHGEELETALQIRSEACAVIHAVLTDVRMGRQIQVERLHPVVTRITQSILRNPGTLVSLCRIREADACTFQHSLSCCALMILFGHHLGLDPATLQEAGVGGMLHDIGKMQVPDHILNKPGRLTSQELEVMRGHVKLGLETLAQTPGISPSVLQVAAQHHERLDGSGYPHGLRGPEIGLLGRMAAVVDVYDALTSSRIYHRGLAPAAGLQYLYEHESGRLDEELVQHFIQAIGIYPVGSLVRLQSGHLAVVIELQPSALRPRVRVVFSIQQKRALVPFDLDLALPEHAGDGIVGHEEPESWALDPAFCLTLTSSPVPAQLSYAPCREAPCPPL
jgi:putative nucleotidyltransferase with HDIG domain